MKKNQCADDTTIILDGSEKSLKTLDLLDQFAKYSGLKPNIEKKTFCLWIGAKIL